MKEISIFIAGILIIIFIVWGIWTAKKHFNYKFQYKSMVEETVKEMVKPEYLKDEYK